MAAVVWHRDPILGEACAAELRTAGHEVLVTDDLQAIEDLAGGYDIAARVAPVDAAAVPHLSVLVLVASGVAGAPPPGDELLHDAQAVLRALLPRMVEQGDGRVVFVVGATGLPGQGWEDGTGAAMWGLVGLARTAARSVAASGVTVNVVRTGHIVDGGDELDPAIVAETPLKRAGTPDDVAAAVGYLASADAAYTTGLVLPVDGGATIGLGA
jgi:hypothetical protein